MLLLVFAITLDAIAPNIQERVMRKGHSPFYTMGNVNFYSSIISFSIFIISNGVSDIINSYSKKKINFVSNDLLLQKHLNNIPTSKNQLLDSIPPKIWEIWDFINSFMDIENSFEVIYWYRLL